MLLSEEKIIHLSQLIVTELKSMQGVRFLQPEASVMREVRQTFINELKLEEDIDRQVRQRLASYSRKIPEGSSEWEILYKKAFDEELKRRRRL